MLQLAPYAVTEHNSRGRLFTEDAPRFRNPFQRDRDRVVHSAAFRRLEYKTQVFVNHEGDMFRTRLTHSIEVAQIGRSIARVLQLNEDLVEAITLAHDLGHTPFGHAGQDALNHCMKPYGGFEHNLQSLRVVDKLEERYADFEGLNLTFETREGILKHCSIDNAKRLGELGKRFLDKTQPSLEAQIANIADEIAYNNHDVDDGLRAELLTIEELCTEPLFCEQFDLVKKRYQHLSHRRMVHETIRRMINVQVTDLVDNTHRRIETVAPDSLEAVRTQKQALVSLSEQGLKKHLSLKRFLREKLYRHYRVHRMTVKAKHTVSSLFDIFMNDPLTLPPSEREKLSAAEEKYADAGRARVVADYIAGMTDRFAILEYERLYDPLKLT